MMNALTVDLEDWFQVSNVEHIIPREAWGECTPRLAESTRRLLALLDRAGVKATFFVLGWNAARFPEVVREVVEAGHEIGSHGYAHQLVYEQSPEQLAQDLAQATEVIGEVTGVRPRCYRAPSFSITPRCPWAFEVVQEAGFAVDASVFPIFHERYGYQQAPRLPHRVAMNGGAGLVEVPPSTIRLAGRNFPFAGGAYFRILPYAVTKAFCRWLTAHGEPLVFYLHPWELDPGIPRFRLSPFRQLRSYVNLHRAEGRLERLLHAFRFGPLSAMLAERPALGQWRPGPEVRARAAGASLVARGVADE
jgi:polysaccharide deacetylase family protein (PEP-CTERM system associated)